MKRVKVSVRADEIRPGRDARLDGTLVLVVQLACRREHLYVSESEHMRVAMSAG